jgi:hypothetical protein
MQIMHHKLQCGARAVHVSRVTQRFCRMTYVER